MHVCARADVPKRGKLMQCVGVVYALSGGVVRTHIVGKKTQRPCGKPPVHSFELLNALHPGAYVHGAVVGGYPNSKALRHVLLSKFIKLTTVLTTQAHWSLRNIIFKEMYTDRALQWRI